MTTRSAPRQNTRAFAIAAELRTIVSKLKRKVREQVDMSGLTPSQIAVVLRMEKDQPVTTSGLARAEGVKPQSMARIIDALRDMEFLTSTPDPTDGRQMLLSLSETGRRWLSEGRAARQDWLTGTVEARLTADEQDRLLAAIALLRRVVDD